MSCQRPATSEFGPDGAIADHTKAIEISPGFADACVGRGTVYQAGSDREHTIADYSKAVVGEGWKRHGRFTHFQKPTMRSLTR